MSLIDDPPAGPDARYRYNHKCEGCGGSYAECFPLWREQKKCCPDCDHHRAHPPAAPKKPRAR